MAVALTLLLGRHGVNLGKLEVGCNFQQHLNFGVVSDFLRERDAMAH